jgi:hypothetical protein
MKKLLICITIYFFIASSAPVERIFSGGMDLVVQNDAVLKIRLYKKLCVLKDGGSLV